MTSRSPTIADHRPALAVLTLAIGPAVGLGICRFAYSLVLPDMRDTLGWSYAASGAMNTVNAAGYLAGALLAAPMAKRIGLLKTIHLGIAMCLVSLAISSLSGAPVPCGFARILSGIGGAFALICGGALAASIAQMHPMRAALLIGLFYNGPAMGLIISGSISPFLLQDFGRGSWWIVWIVLAAISAVMAIPLLRLRLNPVAVSTSGAAAGTVYGAIEIGTATSRSVVPPPLIGTLTTELATALPLIVAAFTSLRPVYELSVPSAPGIDVAIVAETPLGVDTPHDLERARALLAGRGAP